MLYTQEKFLFALSNLIGAMFFALGAVISDGEARWLYVTAAISIMTSAFLSLSFKKLDETIRLVVGRAGIAMMSGIFGTKPVVHYMGLEKQVQEDIIWLGFVAGMCSGLGYALGFAVFKYLIKKSDAIAAMMIDRELTKLLGPQSPAAVVVAERETVAATSPETGPVR